MIRSDYDISDEDFVAVDEPFKEAVDKYLYDNVIHDYIAFYIASGYNLSALWKGSLSGLFNGAIDDLSSVHFGSKEDINRVRDILKSRYKLLLTSDTELEIEEIKE